MYININKLQAFIVFFFIYQFSKDYKVSFLTTSITIFQLSPK